jgi:elongation factor G
VPPDSIEQVRNLVLVGHRGCGKTSLVEALLFDTGMIKRLGSVDQGTTASDVDAEETERGISIMTALCYAEYRDHKVNLIDTPGYAEFIAETTYGVWAADIAGICLDGAAGVEIHTRKCWSMAHERGLAVLGIVTKMDKERASVQACVANMKETLPGCHPVAVQLPIGSESGFKGVIDLLKMKAFTGKGVAAEIPAELAEDAQAARALLVEAVVETRDELMENLADEPITPDELMSALREAIAVGTIVPVVATAGLSEIGILPVLDLVIDLFPNPGQRKPWKGTDPSSEAAIERKADPSAPFSAVIFKTITDPYVGRISRWLLARAASARRCRASAWCRDGRRPRPASFGPATSAA